MFLLEEVGFKYGDRPPLLRVWEQYGDRPPLLRGSDLNWRREIYFTTV